MTFWCWINKRPRNQETNSISYTTWPTPRQVFADTADEAADKYATSTRLPSGSEVCVASDVTDYTVGTVRA